MKLLTGKLPKPLPKKEGLSLKEFHERRNKVLILRRLGGLGDILMHRMIFEDFKRLMPDAHITFACPRELQEAAKNHPFIDEVVDASTVDKSKFAICYDTTSCCLRHELANFPDKVVKNRPDIWANFCGVLCLKHNMYLSSDEKHKESLQTKIQALMGDHPGPAVLFAPMSYDIQRSLTDEQIEGVVDGLRERGYFVFSSHTRPIFSLSKKNVPILNGMTISQWIAMVDISDYVITVDTATFHVAGGLKKPLTGVFTYVDGLVRGDRYDFVLVQKHRHNGDWDCGPCWNWGMCPKSKEPTKPCLTELTAKDVLTGVDEMFKRWPWDEQKKMASGT